MTPNAPSPTEPPPTDDRTRVGRGDPAEKADKAAKTEKSGPERAERPTTAGVLEKSADHPHEAARPGSHRRIWIIVVIVAALLIVFLVTRSSKKKAASASEARAQAANRAVPVLAVTAKRGDIGAYLTGLGTVTAVNTVTVRSRVDGQLVRIAFQEGQLVHEGDLLAEIDPRPFQVQLMQAEGQKAKDEATLKNARLDLARYEALAQSDSIPRQQLDTQQATVSQSLAALKTDEGQIESARLNLAYSHITAPISGRVGLRLVDAGNIIHASDPNGLVVITQLQPIAVLFTIPSDQISRVSTKVAGGTKLAVEAWDRELKNRLAVGALIAIDNQIDPATGTVRLKALFPNESSALYSNQFVNARLLVDTLHGVVLVPTAAIQRSPQSTFAWVVGADDKVQMKNVVVQLTEGDQAAIQNGLAEGDRVVIDGVDKLQPGTKVALAVPGAGGGEPKAPGGSGGAKANGPKGKGKAAS